MNTYCLQNIIFSGPKNLKGAEALYVREPDLNKKRSRFDFRKGDSTDLDTYFNIFNYKKWKQFCDIEQAELKLDISGDFTVSLFNNTRTGRKKISETELRDSGTKRIAIPDVKNLYLLSISIKAGSDGCIEKAGWYGNAKTKPNQNKTAIVICTYKRKDYLSVTLDTLTAALPENWHVITVDNDSSMTDDFTSHYDGRFSFINNPNTGGSGGFTRGLIEALDNKYDYALLMDDDIILDPEALFRTDSLIKLLKAEYKKHFIAGAMLRLDKPTIQHESLAVWTGIRVRPLKHELNLARTGSITKNERETRQKNRYAGWWYCCIPLSAEMKDDLPFPMFIRGDDIEYSLRRAKGFIELNGITVWHEPFDKKYNPVQKHYLIVRNCLIINTLHNFGIFKSLLLIITRLVWQTLKKNKYARRLIRMGVAEYAKGPSVLIESRNPFSREPVLDRKVSLLEIMNKKLINDYKKTKVDLKLWQKIYN